MNQPPGNIARRDFLRACAITRAGLATGFHRQLARATVPASPGGKIAAGLEVGASKVCAAVGERLPNGTLNLLAIGQAPSRGVGRYGILNFEETRACVREALADAEAKSGVMIRSMVLAVGGAKFAPYDGGPQWAEIFESEWEEPCYTDRSDGLLCRVSKLDCKRNPRLRILSGSTGIQSIHCVQSLGIEIERFVFGALSPLQ